MLVCACNSLQCSTLQLRGWELPHERSHSFGNVLPALFQQLICIQNRNLEFRLRVISCPSPSLYRAQSEDMGLIFNNSRITTIIIILIIICFVAYEMLSHTFSCSVTFLLTLPERGDVRQSLLAPSHGAGNWVREIKWLAQVSVAEQYCWGQIQTFRPGVWCFLQNPVLLGKMLSQSYRGLSIQRETMLQECIKQGNSPFCRARRTSFPVHRMALCQSTESDTHPSRACGSPQNHLGAKEVHMTAKDLGQCLVYHELHIWLGE